MSENKDLDGAPPASQDRATDAPHGAASASPPSGSVSTGAGHTPGPWAVNCSHIYAPDGAIIATVHNPGSKASDYPLVANRNLMAAAPDLAEALAKALPRMAHRVSCHRTRPTSEWAEHGSASFDNCDCEIRMVRAALAKVSQP